MQILAPLSRAVEVAPLAANGAGEFYCGLYPEAWRQRFGLMAWPNRRGPGPGNLVCEAELDAVIAACREHERALYLTLNAPFYDDAQRACGREMLAGHEAGLAGVIVSDLGLLAELRRETPHLKCVVSTLGVVQNAETVAFYRDLGAGRVILSRHLRLSEIARIRRQVPDVELEVFVLNDNCRFEEGLCSTLHALPGLGVYCLTDFERRRVDPLAGAAGAGEPASWPEVEASQRAFRQHLSAAGFGAGGVPVGPCALCALPALAASGIDSVKIVGREAGLFRKLRSVQLVRAVLDAVREGRPPRAVKRRAMHLRGAAASCASGFHCYYREARDRQLVAALLRRAARESRRPGGGEPGNR